MNIGKSSELKLHCFCLFDAYNMPKDMCSVITYYGSIPWKIDKCDVRKLGIIKELPEETWI